jgi:putative two-component system response regulator
VRTPNRILIVDDNVDNLAILQEFLSEHFDIKAVTCGEEALRLALSFQPDVILLDLMMPGIDGIDTCRALASYPELQHTRIIMLSARNDANVRMTAYEAGAVDYLAKPFNDREVLMKVRTWMNTVRDGEVREMWNDLEQARDGIGRTLTSLVQLRDTETGDHLFRMRWYTQLLAEQLAHEGPCRGSIDELFLRRLYRATPLHDIGKVGIDDAILRKPAKLTPEEFEIIKSHTTIGADILDQAGRNLPYADHLPMAADIARFHHERFDGRGYPDGLAGIDIPLAARIVSVGDVFDALASDRVYRKAMPVNEAVEIIIAGTGTQFDPVVVKAFHARLDEIKQGHSRFRFLDLAQDLDDDMFARERGRDLGNHVEHRAVEV